MSSSSRHIIFQLKLNDVHIRYEDALTCGSAFAVGLAVESLTAESCDASWCRGFTSVTEPCSFKLLELHNLALYWDPMPVPAGMMADCTIAELTVSWRNIIHIKKLLLFLEEIVVKTLFLVKRNSKCFDRNIRS